jgi:hypothetical protein
MANTIRLQSTLTYKNAAGQVVLGGDFQVNQVGTHFTSEVQDIGTTAEALDVGPDIGTIGFLLIRNLDETNFVEIGSDNAVANNVAVILAGQAVPIKPKSGVTLYGKADTATVKVQFLAIEL